MAKNIRFDNLSDEAHARIVAAFAQTYNYQTQIVDVQGQHVANPQSAEAFCLAQIMNYIDQVSTSVQIANATAAYRTKVTGLVMAASQAARAEIDARVVDASEAEAG